MWICRWTGSSDRPLWSPTEPRRGTEKHMAGPGGVFIKFSKGFSAVKMNMEHNHGGLEDHFPFQMGMFIFQAFLLAPLVGNGVFQKLNNISKKKGQLHKTGSCWLCLIWVCEVCVPFIFVANFHQIWLRRCWNLRNCSMEFSGSLYRW